MNDSSVAEPVHLDAVDAASPTLGLSLLIVRGADARTFLDSQLTRNVPAVDDVASPVGYCSPKGRLLATFVMWRHGDDVALLTSAAIAAEMAKRLRMYVLRSKVTIDDVTTAHALDGLVDPAFAPDLGEPWRVAHRDDGSWLRYPDVDGRRRFLRIGAAGASHHEGAVDASTWRWLDVRSGLATIGTATQDRFVPQMLNLEALGGVDFKKGCYPGQEVVARSQYLGKLKRRMALASLAGPSDVPAAGVDVVQTDKAEPVGLVVDAARGPDGRIALLAELPVALFDSDALHVGTHDGPRLTIEPLPYVLPDNEVFVRPKL